MDKNYTSPRYEDCYQAECFTPRKTLPRSPPSNYRIADENTPPQVSSSIETQMTPDISVGENKQSYEMGDGVLREVQDTCFTPRKSLKRSPPKQCVSKTKASMVNNNDQAVTHDIDAVPPQQRWEIPRTPVANNVQYQQFQVQLSPCQPNKRSTPVRVKTPTHPLSHTNKAVSKKKDVVTKHSNNDQYRMVMHDVDPSPLPKDSKCEQPSTSSPHFPVAKDIGGVSRLPNLKCTENDLAYLQHVRNVRQLTELRSQSEELVKTQKKANEQKELLEHEARKIASDVQNIQKKVSEVSTAVQSLLPGSKTEKEGYQIHQTQLVQLKKLNQLKAVEAERAAREARDKLEQVNKTVLKLNDEIHTLEMRLTIEKTTLQSELQSTQGEVLKAGKRNHQLATQHQAVEDKLESLQSQLSSLKLSDPSVTMNDPQERRENKLQEKQQIEQKLAMIVRRCDLYVQRHKMLKQMGI